MKRLLLLTAIFLTACASGPRFEYGNFLIVEDDSFQQSIEFNADGFLIPNSLDEAML